MRQPGLVQDLTYWGPAGEDRYGNRAFANPVLIKGRWEERNEEVTTIGGETITSAAIVYVDRDVAVNGYLAQGDSTGVSDPHLTTGAAQIQAYQQIPDLRNAAAMRKAVL